MFYHQKVARVRVFADIQNFALCASHSQEMCDTKQDMQTPGCMIHNMTRKLFVGMFQVC